VRWTCPRCDRQFGRTNQSHVCVPGCTVDDSFAGRPDWQRAAYDAVLAHLRDQGPVHEDAVQVGVFLLAQRKFAEVRPMARSLNLWLILPRLPSDPRIARSEPLARGRFAALVKLGGPDDVDDQLRGWLSEAVAAADD
jgi:hypothetical protein